MALTIDNPKKYSGSQNPNYLRVRSDLFQNLGFRFKIEFQINNQNIFQPIFLAPSTDTGGRIVVDVNKLMRNRVKLEKSVELLGKFYPLDQTTEYDIKLTETFIDKIDMVEYYWIQPYAGEFKTVIEVANHNFAVGDLIRIENAAVTNIAPGSSKQIIEDALNGIHTVTDIIDSTQFAIDSPFSGSATFVSGSGQIYYNDNRPTTGANSIINDVVITYGYKNQFQLLDPNGKYYNNEYNTLLQDNNINLDMLNIDEIYEWQYYYINLFENKLDAVHQIRFSNGVQTDNYNIQTAVHKNKQVLINPNLIPGITNTYTGKYKIELIDKHGVSIVSKNMTIKPGNCLYENQIFYYDYYGNLASMPITRRMSKEIKANIDGHIHHKYTLQHYQDNDYYMSTEANIEEILEVGEDWLSYTNYLKIEELLASPYKWIKTDEKISIPIEIVDKNYVIMSDKSTTRYKLDLKIKLLK